MRRAAYVSILVVLFAGLQFLFGNNDLWDDSFIGMLYARNLARGVGPFFLTLQQQAVSGYSRVEGFSNPLWTLLTAGFYWLPGSVFLWIKLASFFSAVALGLFSAKLLREITGKAGKAAPVWVTGLAALLVALNPSVLVYTKSGMETVSFTALVLAGLWHTLRTDQEPRSCNQLLNMLLWLAVALTRPEGILYAGVAGLFLLVTLRKLLFRRLLLNWLLPFFLLFTGFLLLRHFLYGEWLPNTFYAKVALRADGDIRSWVGILKTGLRYSGQFFRERLGVEMLFALAGFIWLKNLSYRALSLVGLVMASNLVFVASVGGDFWPLFRFFQVTWCLINVLSVVPILMVVVGQPLPNFAGAKTIWPGRIWSPVLAVVLLAFQPITQFFQNPLFYGTLPLLSMERVRQTLTARHATPLFVLGKWVKENLPANAVLAVDQAGQIPYYADREVVDVMGLNDHYLARHPLEWSYLRRRGVTHWLAAVVEREGEPSLLYPELLQQTDFRASFCLTRVFEGLDEYRNRDVIVLFTRRDRLSDQQLLLCREAVSHSQSLSEMLSLPIPKTVLSSSAVKDLKP
ncbi:MAG: hypothetical protein ACE15E_05460 [Acidobacteriota bacterium]